MVSKLSDDEDTHFGEQLEVLRSIYPEIEVSNNNIHVKIECDPPSPLSFVLCSSTGKGLEEFTSLHLEPLTFCCGVPITPSNFKISSSWVSLNALEQMNHDIQTIIKDGVETDDPFTLLYIVIDYIMVQSLPKYQNIIYQSSNFTTEDRQIFLRFQEMCHTQRQIRFKKSRFKCSICLEYTDGKSGILLDCDHSFCKSCFKQYAEQAINSDDVTKLQCPNCPIEPLKDLQLKSCTELKQILFTKKISVDVLRSVIDQDLLTKYEELLNQLNFLKYQQYFPYSCDTCPRCEKWLFRDDSDNLLMQCDKCLLSYCFNCRHSWHGDFNACGRPLDTVPKDVIELLLEEDCSEITRAKYEATYGKRNLRLAIDTYVADKLFQDAVENGDDLMKCPNCETVISKSDGCNKMKCSVCDTNFCYKCGEMIDATDPYLHYRDPTSRCYGKLFHGMAGADEDPHEHQMNILADQLAFGLVD